MISPSNKITRSDLRQQAQELIDSGRMPSLDQLLQVAAEVRAKYVPQILQARADHKKKKDS